MKSRTAQSDNVIRGSCPLFVCKCCRTKYGWTHQAWCDNAEFVQPECGDCQYYDPHDKGCVHPAKKRTEGYGF